MKLGATIRMFAIAYSLFLVGCFECKKLRERVCNDLGPVMCAEWRQANGPAKLDRDFNRGDNRICAAVLDDAIVVDYTVDDQRRRLLAARVARATQLGDSVVPQRARCKRRAQNWPKSMRA
jgi:hypothetical protein